MKMGGMCLNWKVLAELKAQLTILEVRQQAVAREIADLELAGGTAVREAEAVAQAAALHVAA